MSHKSDCKLNFSAMQRIQGEDVARGLGNATFSISLYENAEPHGWPL